MIWIWLWEAICWLGRMILPPPTKPIPSVDPNALCPACGHRDGKIICVPRFVDVPEMHLRHTCNICGAQWFEPTVIKDTIGIVYPSELSLN